MAVAPTLSASIYLNSAPVVYAFSEGSQADRCRFLGDAAPSRCARALAEGVADAALIPVVEYHRIDGLFLARGVCVGARERVRSVLLVAKRPLHAVRSVALDTSSRTSAALVRIVFERFVGTRPDYAQAEPNLRAMLERHDAALVIGDPAMVADVSGYDVHDMAELWRAYTGLGFVFAVWGIRAERIARGSLDFVAARDEGLAAVPLLAERYSRTLGLERGSLIDYLTTKIHYALDDDSLEGMSLFARYAAEAGLITVPRAVRLWPE